jgi:acyl carrier protein phosphodiesterase
MNLLGHLFFSDNDHQLMFANLYGDHFKGKDFTGLPDVIKKGVLLHRTIDNYIDHHPEVLTLLHDLYSELPKVSGIAVDLYFDHLLASRWHEFHSTPLNTFLNSFYRAEIENENAYSKEFLHFIEALKHHQWISHYASRSGLDKMCNGVSSRISFINALNKAPLVFDKKYKHINRVFEIYMSDAQSHFTDYLQKAGVDN